ncbi:MAG: LCP family protein [Oscillospiraceae bacterium]|nr:LCP family protein [Oscillospiraceae bacterium]
MEERERGYRRPIRKKWNPAGMLSVCCGLAVVILYVVLGAILLQKLLGRSMGYSDIQTLLNGALAAAILSGVGLLGAIVGFFLRGRKKAGSITGLILCLLLLAASCAVLWIYHYTTGSLQTDHAFRDIAKEELGVVETEADGRIDRETEATEGTLSPEEFQEQTGLTEIERYLLVNEDIPEEALAAMRGTPPEGESYLLPGAEQIQNIVLYGLDKAGSSDCIIILSVDHVHKKIKLTSISRDSYVPIANWGSYSRITYAYNKSGAEMALRTLNQSFSLNITDYITVELDQLATIIDYVGGVEVDLDYDELAALRFPYNLTVGKCRLTGEQAVSYSRMRSTSYRDNEFNRTGRQREVVLGLMNELLKKPYTEFPQLVRVCLGLCETSLESGELLDICMKVVLEGYSFDEQYLIPGDLVEYWGGRIGEYAYCVYDLNRASDEIYRIIYEDLYVSGYAD